MKNICQKSILSAALFFTMYTANAKGNSLVYSRSQQEQIGITATNQAAVGSNYKVLDGSGKTVMTGRIKSADTFYIPTGKLSNGSYRFCVDGYNLQEFSVNN